METVVTNEILENKIYFIRGQKVMIDKDLAELYGVETKQLKRQVNRNIQRFPEDFMFQLTEFEHQTLRRQFGTLKQGQHSKFLPYCFTEQGVAMLSSVLGSERAISVNIQIIRTFAKLRVMIADNLELRLAIEEIKKKTENNRKNIELVFQYLDELLQKDTEETKRTKIAYKT